MSTSNATEDLDIDLELGEHYYQDQKELEQRLTHEIVEVIYQYIKKRFEDGRRPALRDAHAKHTGFVAATFHVDSALDRELRHGVFSPGREYKAWIRFSNGNCELRSDRWPDARGMAIKLLDVHGEKLLGDEHETQDFIMINSPAFFVDDLQRYKDTLRLFLTPGILSQYRSILQLKGRERWLSFKANLKWITNPLFCQYWSTTPYCLGVDRQRIAIKFTAKPWMQGRGDFLARVATFFAPGFSLEAEVEKALFSERRFDFYIQRYVDPDLTPIENTTLEWKESVSEPIHVATITIPPQTRSSSERDSRAENLSFSPWHCLREHKPLGAVNRVRKVAYLKNSEHRHKLNAHK